MGRESINVTPENLRQLLRYDPLTGLFVWLVRPNGRVPAGRIAGSPNKDGYIQIKIKGRLFGAHRLAWMHVHGGWPAEEVDHKNGKRSDNRIDNLRIATRVDQMANLSVPKSNTSGFKGVSRDKTGRRWRANIIIGGKQKHLGIFDTPELAHEAYAAAAISKSGEFARLS